MKRLMIVVSVAVFLASVSASAATINYHQVVTGSSIGTYDIILGASPLTISVPKFPAPASKLTGVTVSFTLDYSGGYVYVDNNSSGTARYQGVQASLLQIDLSGPPTGDSTFNISISSLPIGGSYTNTLIKGGHVQFPSGDPTHPLLSGGYGGTVNVNPADFAAFANGGSLDYFVDAFASAIGTCNYVSPGSCTTGVNMNFVATLDVTYSFTSIPEPATMAFAGLGLLALGFFGRRFARR